MKTQWRICPLKGEKKKSSVSGFKARTVENVFCVEKKWMNNRTVNVSHRRPSALLHIYLVALQWTPYNFCECGSAAKFNSQCQIRNKITDFNATISLWAAIVVCTLIRYLHGTQQHSPDFGFIDIALKLLKTIEARPIHFDSEMKVVLLAHLRPRCFQHGQTLSVFHGIVNSLRILWR